MELICVTNRRLCKGDFFARLAEIASLDGVKIILREKDLSPQEYEAMAKKAVKICGREKLIINGFLTAAKSLNADSIVLPFDSFMALDGQERESFNSAGVSVHSEEQAAAAESKRADFCLAGHIFATDCKKGLAPRGVRFLRRVRENFSGRLYAIGGIAPENVHLCKAAGADGVCVMSGFMVCENVFDFYESFRRTGEFDD